MRIAILSDTHGNCTQAVRSLDLSGAFDCIIHLGDTTDDAEFIELALERELVIVSGNCDAGGKYPRSMTLEIAGKIFFICHGDRSHVKAGLTQLYQKALQVGADIVLYGHTHIPLIEEINNILFINPGAMKKSSKNPTMGILHIDGGMVRAEIIDVN
jgi:putative phosphoesterase